MYFCGKFARILDVFRGNKQPPQHSPGYAIDAELCVFIPMFFRITLTEICVACVYMCARVILSCKHGFQSSRAHVISHYSSSYRWVDRRSTVAMVQVDLRTTYAACITYDTRIRPIVYCLPVLLRVGSGPLFQFPLVLNFLTTRDEEHGNT